MTTSSSLYRFSRTRDGKVYVTLAAYGAHQRKEDSGALWRDFAVCALFWSLIYGLLPRKCQLRHLLWALMLLKLYECNNVNSAMEGVDDKTLRKYKWLIFNVLAIISILRKLFIYSYCYQNQICNKRAGNLRNLTSQCRIAFLRQ